MSLKFIYFWINLLSNSSVLWFYDQIVCQGELPMIFNEYNEIKFIIIVSYDKVFKYKFRLCYVMGHVSHVM